MAVRSLVSIVAGIAVAVAWMGIWAALLHGFGISGFAFGQGREERASRRERIKKMGKLRYVLVFGVLGFGLAFGFAMTVLDSLELHSRGWLSELAKLALISILLGWFQGARTWSEAFRDPIPFPPDYPPARNPVPSPPDYMLVK